MISPTGWNPESSRRAGEVLRSLPLQLAVGPPDLRIGAAPGLVMTRVVSVELWMSYIVAHGIVVTGGGDSTRELR